MVFVGELLRINVTVYILFNVTEHLFYDFSATFVSEEPKDLVEV
jgi:hypothetical protein